MIAAKLSIMKSLHRAWRPGTNSCAISTRPAKRTRQKPTSACRRCHPTPEAKPVAQKIAKCSSACGAPVSGRPLGGTSDKTTITVARTHVVTRATAAMLKPIDLSCKPRTRHHQSTDCWDIEIDGSIKIHFAVSIYMPSLAIAARSSATKRAKWSAVIGSVK